MSDRVPKLGYREEGSGYLLADSDGDYHWFIEAENRDVEAEAFAAMEEYGGDLYGIVVEYRLTAVKLVDSDLYAFEHDMVVVDKH